MAPATGSPSDDVRRRERLISDSLVGGVYTPQQVRVQQAIRSHRRVVVHSGHSTGKSFVCADLVLWFKRAYPAGIVITTAPTWRQVTDILWKTLRLRYANSRVDLGGILLPRAPRWTFDDESFAEGISTDESARLQGYHGKHLLVLIDEAAGVDAEIWDATTRLATGELNFIVAIGNPGAPHGPFFEAAMENPTWHTIHLDSEEHPNVQTGVELIPGAATRDWCEGMAEQYGGRDSVRYRAFVRGEFPTEGTDTLISGPWVDRAFERGRITERVRPVVCIGVDVARFGDDETVIATLDGATHVRTVFTRGRDLMHTVGMIVDEFHRHDPEQTQVVVDADGIGAGVVDRLREIGLPVLAFHGGLRPRYRPRAGVSDRRRERYFNARAEAWHLLAEALRLDEISLRPDKMTKSQLTGLTYAFTSDGLIKLERKEDLKKRLPHLGSPDRADALVMAWWLYTGWDLPVAEKVTRRRKTWIDEAAEIMGGDRA